VHFGMLVKNILQRGIIRDGAEEERRRNEEE
jgi:hypothetical protein